MHVESPLGDSHPPAAEKEEIPNVRSVVLRSAAAAVLLASALGLVACADPVHPANPTDEPSVSYGNPSVIDLAPLSTTTTATTTATRSRSEATVRTETTPATTGSAATT